MRPYQPGVGAGLVHTALRPTRVPHLSGCLSGFHLAVISSEEPWQLLKCWVGRALLVLPPREKERPQHTPYPHDSLVKYLDAGLAGTTGPKPVSVA